MLLSHSVKLTVINSFLLERFNFLESPLYLELINEYIACAIVYLQRKNCSTKGRMPPTDFVISWLDNLAMLAPLRLCHEH